MRDNYTRYPRAILWLVRGGVATIDDLVAVKKAGLAGAIVGRALYEKNFTLADALKRCAEVE